MNDDLPCQPSPLWVYPKNLVSYTTVMPLELNGYSAHIRCDGEELEMYSVRRKGTRTALCWIASEEGKVRLNDIGSGRRPLTSPYVYGRWEGLAPGMINEYRPADGSPSPCIGQTNRATPS